MRHPVLSIRSVVAGLGTFSVIIAIGLASFSLFAISVQKAGLEKVILLQSAIRTHTSSDEGMDNARTDILRTLQEALGWNREGTAVIEADVQRHVAQVAAGINDNLKLPLSPSLHEQYVSLVDLAGNFSAAVREAVRLAANDPMEGARNYETFRSAFSSLEDGMDASRDALELGLREAEENSAAAATFARHVIVESVLGGAVVLLLMTAVAVAIVRKITHDLASSRAEAHRLSLHDPLTGLPNRAMFAERVEGALCHVRKDRQAAMLCIDLDRFKQVNDTLGHSTGDVLLRSVAERLRANVREGDTVARLGGDEFAVVMAPITTADEASSLAARLIAALSEPYDLAGHRMVIGASIGVALAPHDTADASELLKMADLALYRAKSEGRGVFCFFEAGMDAKLHARRTLEADLRHAVEAQQFELHYQPLVQIASGLVGGFEALVRWRHPERGMVSPGEFIPVAEDTGLIIPLGSWVLRQACQDAATWPSGVSVAVNISAVQFRGEGLVAAVFDALAASGLDPHRLELEITETALLADADATLATLRHLQAFGVRIAMDDFGTGYSSLSYLRSFSFDKIKIDQSFIRDIETSADCKSIVRAITGLGLSLGIATTAEGVETLSQFEHLRAEGCDMVQGYYFSRPVPGALVPDVLRAHGVPGAGRPGAPDEHARMLAAPEPAF